MEKNISKTVKSGMFGAIKQDCFVRFDMLIKHALKKPEIFLLKPASYSSGTYWPARFFLLLIVNLL